MHIHLGADHGGYEMRSVVIALAERLGLACTDHSSPAVDPSDDYPDIAIAVARCVQDDPAAIGVLLCRSGQGMAMTANRFPLVRAAVGFSVEEVVESRRDNWANILVLGADFITAQQAELMAEHFITQQLTTEERHIRRIKKIELLGVAS
jgi:ribose 5-phosphate isomerase B